MQELLRVFDAGDNTQAQRICNKSTKKTFNWSENAAKFTLMGLGEIYIIYCPTMVCRHLPLYRPSCVKTRFVNTCPATASCVKPAG